MAAKITSDFERLHHTLRNHLLNYQGASMIQRLLIFTLVCALTGCAATSPVVTNDLTGDWMLSLPAGYTYRVSLHVAGKDKVSIAKGGNLSGTFRVRGHTLTIIDPQDKRKADSTWTIVTPDKLVLTRSPHGMGSDYTGATLTRPVPDDVRTRAEQKR